MARLKFRIRGKQNPSPIYARFINGSTKDFEIKSGYFCNPLYFNSNKGSVKNVAEFKDKHNLQSNLNELKSDILRSLNTSSIQDKDWLQSQINKHHGILTDSARPLLTEVIEKYIYYKEFSAKNEVTQSTLKSFGATLYRVKEFQTFKKKKFYIDQVGSDFKDEFIGWARNNANYQHSTYSKSIKQIKAICRYAKTKKKYKVDDTIFLSEEGNGKTKKKEDITFPHLDFDNLSKLMTYEGPDYLTNARDWLVISCWTGCRVSDLMNLTTDNINKTILGERAIEYVQVKTGRKVQTPIHPDVDIILKKNEGFPKVISHQKFNDYIKKVCKESGIDEVIKGSKMNPDTKRKVFGAFPKYELVTSHIGRRSFATNHYGKFSNHGIMQVTGHATERQFLDYIGKRNTDHITHFMEYWNQIYSTDGGRKTSAN
jgi:integrase